MSVCVSSATLYIIHEHIIFVPNWIQGGRHFSSPNDQYGRKKYVRLVNLNLCDKYKLIGTRLSVCASFKSRFL